MKRFLVAATPAVPRTTIGCLAGRVGAIIHRRTSSYNIRVCCNRRQQQKKHSGFAFARSCCISMACSEVGDRCGPSGHPHSPSPAVCFSLCVCVCVPPRPLSMSFSETKHQQRAFARAHSSSYQSTSLDVEFVSSQVTRKATGSTLLETFLRPYNRLHVHVFPLRFSFRGDVVSRGLLTHSITHPRRHAARVQHTSLQAP